MGGGILQLVIYGEQDKYLTGNPQITFFKSIYRRHTNFSIETIEQRIDGSKRAEEHATVTISKSGDLVHKVYITNVITSNTGGGSGIIKDVDIKIGGQLIDKHTSEWNQIWNELTIPTTKSIIYKSMVGDINNTGEIVSTMSDLDKMTITELQLRAINEGVKQDIVDQTDNSINQKASLIQLIINQRTMGVRMIQYPLNFWFCRNPGLSIPINALHYQDVVLTFTWGSENYGLLKNTEVNPDLRVWCDYIYLDTDERQRFSQISHEYLIEQIQVNQFHNDYTSQNLNFKHPVKELIWTSQPTGGYNTAHLIMNGYDRFCEQNSEYFQIRQPYDYHTSIPYQNLPKSSQIITNNTNIQKRNDLQIKSISATTGNTATIGEGNMIIGTLGANGLIKGVRTALSTVSVTTTEAILKNKVDGSESGQACVFTQIDVIKMGLMVGDFYKITGKGSHWIEGGETGSSIITKVTHICFGNAILPNVGYIHEDDAIVCFDKLLVSKTIHINDSSKFTIVNISPLTPKENNQSSTSTFSKLINVYSFCLNPEEYQPSGYCNFSKINSCHLQFDTSPTSGDRIYAINYNILRIMSGTGTLIYLN